MFYYLCRFVSVTASLLYPTYASYKALKSTASSGLTAGEQAEQLERWLMYWCVMGIVWMWEEWGEWGVKWFPFYYEVKTLVILWLVLPQIQGSTYIYLTHLAPFLASQETDIDSFVTSTRSRAKAIGLEFLNRGIQRARQAILGQVFATDAGGNRAPPPYAMDTDEPPVLADPYTTGGEGATAASSLLNLAGGFMKQYGPSALAAGAALLHPMGRRQQQPETVNDRDARQRRKAQLEAELAALSGDASSWSEPPSSPAGSSSSYSGTARASASAPASRIFHPRAVSSASLSSLAASLSPGDPLRLRTSSSSSVSDAETQGAPRDPGGQRYVEANLAGSHFEEIARDEAKGYAGGRGGWFGWGGGGARALVDPAKKNA
ncbi:hypothetical protein JCM21900_006598 [Sporobolomyces salmonicolor]